MELGIWHILLLIGLLLPFSFDRVKVSCRVANARMLRVWLVLATASMVTQVYQSIPVYIFIDLIAAAIVLARPRCAWQKAIGLIMLTMATMSIGFMIAELAHLQNFLTTDPDELRLWEAYVWLSWAELIVFFVWGGHDWLARFADNHSIHWLARLAANDGRD